MTKSNNNIILRINVSIIENSDDIRDALRVFINGSAGFECIHAFANADEAMRLIPEKVIDVVLLDISLPGINPVECIKALRSSMPDSRFMVCTLHDDDHHIFSALQSGATGYVLKRTSPAGKLEAIRDLYEGGSPMSSEIARRVFNALQKTGKVTKSVEVLTDREKDILDYLAKGYLYKETAIELSISKETVKKHIHGIYDKLHAQTCTESLSKVFGKHLP